MAGEIQGVPVNAVCGISSLKDRMTERCAGEQSTYTRKFPTRKMLQKKAERAATAVSNSMSSCPLGASSDESQRPPLDPPADDAASHPPAQLPVSAENGGATMNAHEREAAERLEGWIFGSSNTPADADNIRTVLAAVRRYERLAHEGLTEEELEDVEIFRNEMPAGKTIVGETVLHVIAKLQAQLADAKERTIEAEGIASDALEDRGLPRIEEVRRETARECAMMAEDHKTFCEAGLIPDGNPRIADSIRRRFGLAAPQPAEPAEVCLCRGSNAVCELCAGTGRTPPDDDRRSIRRCLEDRP